MNNSFLYWLKSRKFLHLLVYFFSAVCYLCGCQKVEYATVDSPAYLRVFNSLTDRQVLGGDEELTAYLCMLINPQFDANGLLQSAAIVGDFLDKREPYAAPYPTHIGVESTVGNTEYPGKEVVPVGPIVNGFDLSSWAQIPSGTMRIVFMYRPKNTTPFFNLADQYKKNVMADTTLTLEAGEVYTLQTLLFDFNTKRKGVLLRKESFHKQSFSDEQVYVNFYNYSAKGFWQAPDEEKKSAPSLSRGYEYLIGVGIRDTMDVYYSLYTGKRGYRNNQNTTKGQTGIVFDDTSRNGQDPLKYILPAADKGFDRNYLTTIKHDNFSGQVMPYAHFPLWSATDTTGKIYTDQWQRFFFLAPGLDINNIPYSEHAGGAQIDGIWQNPQGNFAIMNCLLYQQRIYYSPSAGYDYNAGVNMPNLIVNIHSGVYNPRSFATVNTVEVINGNLYLMTIQRKYDPPVYGN